jgi:hypothetical protein
MEFYEGRHSSQARACKAHGVDNHKHLTYYYNMIVSKLGKRKDPPVDEEKENMPPPPKRAAQGVDKPLSPGEVKQGVARRASELYGAGTMTMAAAGAKAASEAGGDAKAPAKSTLHKW